MPDKGRRKFLGVCIGGLFAVGAGAIAYPVFSFLAPRKEAGSSNKVEIPEAELAEGSAKFFEYEGKAAVLIRKKGGALVALSAVCTHLGCIVQWQKDKEQLLCPCHAGLYIVWRRYQRRNRCHDIRRRARSRLIRNRPHAFAAHYGFPIRCDAYL